MKNISTFPDWKNRDSLYITSSQMGCANVKSNDPNVPRCAGNNYPRNPAYGNQPQRDLAGPVNVPVGPDGGRDHVGEVMIAGAILSHGHYGHCGPGFGGDLGPTLYNPITGGYSDF